ncbi:unnamed protein product [Closterium sp. Naga37s-1]|nr:unnamed protein product [Closterium sp. Naga37s-1]
MPASRLSRFPLPLPRFPPLSHVSPTPTLSSIPYPVLYEPVLLLVASTWLHGSPSDHAAFFLRWLHKSASGFSVGATLLAPLLFVVFGLRSSAYDEAEEAGGGEGEKLERVGCCASSADAGGGAGAVEGCECSAGGGCNDGRYFNTVARAADEDLVALGVRRLAHMRECDEAEGGDVDSTFHEWVSAIKSALAAANGGSGNGATLRASGGQEEDEEEEVEEEEEEEEGYEEYKGESEEEEGEGEGRAEGLVDLEDVAGPHAPARAHANALTRGTLWARALAGTAREALRGGEMAVAEGVARGAGMGKSRGGGWFGKGTCTRTMRG